MSDEITFAGKPYVSSKRASKISGYAQDYIGQLARSGQIEAQRIGGLWYISMDSLLGYRKPSDAPAAEVPPVQVAEEAPTDVPFTASSDVDSFISFDGKDYISAARASKLTGYNQDYVGQLARSGQILARQISSRWYVDREGILKHKNEKDALLAAVQAESVGIPAPIAPMQAVRPSDVYKNTPQLSYFHDDSDLMPVMGRIERQEQKESPWSEKDEISTAIPIRRMNIASNPLSETNVMPPEIANNKAKKSWVSAQTGVLAAAALTVVIVLSFGIRGLKANSTYVLNSMQLKAFTASVGGFTDKLGDVLESILSPELRYDRGE